MPHRPGLHRAFPAAKLHSLQQGTGRAWEVHIKLAPGRASSKVLGRAHRAHTRPGATVGLPALRGHLMEVAAGYADAHRDAECLVLWRAMSGRWSNAEAGSARHPLRKTLSSWLRLGLQHALRSPLLPLFPRLLQQYHILWHAMHL